MWRRRRRKDEDDERATYEMPPMRRRGRPVAAYDLGRMERFGMMRTGKAGVWYKAECTAGCGMAGEEYRTSKRQAAEDWNARCRKRERVREALRR